MKAPGGTTTDGVEAYKTLIDAMLEITDNLTDHGIVHSAAVKVLTMTAHIWLSQRDKRHGKLFRYRKRVGE